MADGSHNLFAIGQKGVNLVSAITHLDEAELRLAQNVEIVPIGGEGAIDQRAGMTKINAAAIGGGASIATVHDVSAQLQSDLTPTLYAPLTTGLWRKSTNGTVWSSINPGSAIFNGFTSGAAWFKAWPKVVTLGNKLYFIGQVNTQGTSPVPVYVWDGITLALFAYLPPSVIGTVLATPDAPVLGLNGASGASTYTYKFVARSGSGHSIASAAASQSGAPATLDVNGFISFSAVTPVGGATSYDVYRTAGGSTQGFIGSIPIVNGVMTNGNGSGTRTDVPFTDAGLTGDGSTAPVAATGSVASTPLQVVDFITDGTNLYLAVLDSITGGWSGRILSLDPSSALFTQLGSIFPIAAGVGVPGSLNFWGGSINYATHKGTASGAQMYATTSATPLPAGGVIEVQTFTASFAPTALVAFLDGLYVSHMWLGVAGTAGRIDQRKTGATWTTVRNGPGTAVGNGYTTMLVHAGKLVAGWTSGDGSSAARMESTANGTDWVLEQALAVGEIPMQMVAFTDGNLYLVTGVVAGQGWNVTSRIWKRTPAGAWSVVDTPGTLTGAIGIVYA
jgi:hypothetical protein